MRNTIMVTALLMTTWSCAQSNVPETVKAAFQKQYPEVKGVKWEKEEANYEVEFELNKTETSVVYDAAGNLLETEVEISVDALPENVKKYVAAQHPGQKIKEAAKITNAKGTVTYEAEVKGKDLIFDSAGNFIK